MKKYLTIPMLLTLALVPLMSLSAGCQLPVALASMAFPNEDIPAQFKVPPDKVVLVFPDDMTNPVSYPPIKRELAYQVSEYLKSQKVVRDTVPYQKVVDLQANDPEFNRHSVVTVGRKLGADLVIYINIERFELKDSPNDSVWHANIEGRVRVVDVAAQKRLWPDESAGFPFKCGLPLTDNPSPTFGHQLTKALAAKSGTEIGYLFNKHSETRSRPKEKESELDH